MVEDQSLDDEEYEGGGYEADEDDSDDESDDDESGAPPPPPNMDYRNLLLRLGTVDPRIVDIAEKRSRAFVDGLKSFRSAASAVQSASLPDQRQEKKRKRMEGVHNKLDQVGRERARFKTNSGTASVIVPKGKVQPKKKVTLKAVRAGAAHHVVGKDEQGARPYGFQKGTFNTRAGAVHAIPPEVKIGEQTKQYLTYVSELLFRKVETMEVEAMLVNKRYLVSANETTTVAQLAGLKLSDLMREAARALMGDNPDIQSQRRYKIGVMGEALAVVPDGEEPSDLQKAGAMHLAEAQVGFRADHDARPELEDFLRILQQQVRNDLEVQGPFSIDEAARLIEDGRYQHTVIAVKALGGGHSHAEQHLALALIKSGHTGRAVVAGTKNPCSVCWMSLALAVKRGWKIEFNNKPGGLWETSVVRGLAEVARSVGIVDVTDLWKILVEANNLLPDSPHFTQYLTSLREGAGLIVKIPTTGGGLAAQGLTQDTSGLHQDFIETGPPMSPLGSPFQAAPASPPGHWGTPESSPSRQEAEEHQARLDKWKAENE